MTEVSCARGNNENENFEKLKDCDFKAIRLQLLNGAKLQGPHPSCSLTCDFSEVGNAPRRRRHARLD